MKPILWAVCLAAVLAAPAHAKERPQPFKALTGAFFGVSVANMAQSVEWYSDNLGLAVAFHQVQGTFEVTVLQGGGLTVELIHDPPAQPPVVARPDLTHGVFKAGFFVKDFDSTVDELRARDVAIAFGPFPARDGMQANLIIRDNAGNLIQIFGD